MNQTLVLRVDPKKPDPELIAYSARVVRDGGLVAFPTETVYGIAVNLTAKRAIDRLYKVKKRSRGKPLTVHIADTGTIRKMGCKVTKIARKLIDRYWPGPLTILLKSAAGATVGFRMPANEVAIALIRSSRVPVGAPSANLSGRLPPKDAKRVLGDLDGKIDVLLDAGPTRVRIESTVVDVTVDPPVIVREGAIRKRELAKIIPKISIRMEIHRNLLREINRN